MALYFNINKTLHMWPLPTLVLKCLLPKLHCHSFNKRSENIESGSIDDFTSQLVQRKTGKWENRKLLTQQKLKSSIISKKETSGNIGTHTDVKLMDIKEINLLFECAIDVDDNFTIMNLTKQCIKYEKCPSLSLLLHALSICSQTGDKSTIVEIAKLCERVRPEVLPENSHFEHYLAEAIWVKGNIIQSLEVFEKVYKENVYLRRRIRLTLQYLISDIINNRSEAILINLIRFSETLAKDYNDYFPLACLWQSCFLSEWFTDQQQALELLDRNDGLCEAILNRIPYVVNVSLKCHRTEVVYRLTEMLLKFKIGSELVIVLLALIDYWIKQGNVKRCNEIIHWSLKYKLSLPAIPDEKIVGLILNDNRIHPVKSAMEARKKQALTHYKF